MNSKSPARIRSIHIPKLVQAIEHAEIENGISIAQETPGKQSPPIDTSLEDLIRAIAAKGFEVTIKPRAA
ncbi:MAG: hypothetical protein NVS2B5_20240 [Beijerinckiaceae bacterium]